MNDNKELALEITQRVREMENEIRSLRAVLRKYWTYSGDPEAFVQKGIQQLQDRETAAQESERLQQVFHEATDDAVLLRSLHTEVLRRLEVQ